VPYDVVDNKLVCKNDFRKIDDYVENKLKIKEKASRLFVDLGNLGNIIIIGGAVRDIVINDTEPRDIDIIVDTDEEIDYVIKAYDNVHKNRFGGFKLFIDELEFDIWSTRNHWAFKENILNKSISNIKYSTFLNFDSIFYNLTTKEGEAELFNNCIANSYLDFTLNKNDIYKNPSKDTNILRMLIIKDQWSLNFSDNVKKYIEEWCNSSINSNELVENLLIAQRKHYRNRTKISKQRICFRLREFMNIGIDVE